MQVRINLPTELFRELESAAASMHESGYTAVNFATDVLASEMASRRLPRVAQGRYGARVIGAEQPEEPVTYPVMWPETE